MAIDAARRWATKRFPFLGRQLEAAVTSAAWQPVERLRVAYTVRRPDRPRDGRRAEEGIADRDHSPFRRRSILGPSASNRHWPQLAPLRPVPGVMARPATRARSARSRIVLAPIVVSAAVPSHRARAGSSSVRPAGEAAGSAAPAGTASWPARDVREGRRDRLAGPVPRRNESRPGLQASLPCCLGRRR